MSLVSYRYISDDSFSCQSSQWLLSVRATGSMAGASWSQRHLSDWQVGCYLLEQDWIPSSEGPHSNFHKIQKNVLFLRLLPLLKELANKFKSCGTKSKDSMTGNVTKDASTDQKTSILLQFTAAYAPESISAKAGDLIKKCRPILIQVYLERWTHICCLRKKIYTLKWQVLLSMFSIYEHCSRCPCEMKRESNIGSSGDTKAVFPSLNLFLIIFRGNIN